VALVIATEATLRDFLCQTLYEELCSFSIVQQRQPKVNSIPTANIKLRREKGIEKEDQPAGDIVLINKVDTPRLG
jgi:hypothetical protein